MISCGRAPAPTCLRTAWPAQKATGASRLRDVFRGHSPVAERWEKYPMVRSLTGDETGIAVKSAIPCRVLEIQSTQPAYH
mmetsp:Transcript_10541/g.25540  ORF Transcript_10541/g.25540 Transcript_10541/m.25540 type:complete len:80 (+) Transcript_10541:1433-1672(+)